MFSWLSATHLLPPHNTQLALVTPYDTPLQPVKITRGLLYLKKPMIYTSLCIMFLMQADTLRRQVGGGWALEIESFLGPVKWHRAHIIIIYAPMICPSNGSACIKNHYAKGHINLRCIGGFMYKSPRVILTGCKGVSYRAPNGNRLSA